MQENSQNETNQKKQIPFWVQWIWVPIATLIIGGAVGYFLGGMNGGASGSGEGAVSFVPQRKADFQGKWLVQIEEFVITKDEFEKDYQTFLQQVQQNGMSQYQDSPMLRQQYLDNLVDQQAVIIKAVKENRLNNPQFMSFLKTYLRQGVLQMMLQQSMPADQSEFTPTPQEIDAVYQQQKQNYDAAGMNETQAKQYIAQTLMQQKQQNWQMKYIDQVKEDYKIERNQSVMREAGIGL